MKSIVFKMLILILFLYFGATLYLYLTQDKKIFNREVVDNIEVTIAKKITFKPKDGVILEGAYLENRKDAPLVLYFGGNNSNVIYFIDKVAPKIKNFNFVAFNYPGYGGSLGEPNEMDILEYADKIYQKYKPDIVAGRSLGSAVAIYVSAQNDAKSLLLITPIDSILKIAKAKYPFLPVELVLKHKFEGDIWARKLKAKVAVLLVEKENIVPKENIENILNSIPNLVYKSIIKGADHKNLYQTDITKEIEKALEAIK